MIIKHKSANTKNTVDITKIIGKKVLSKSGKMMGFIETLQVNPKKLTIEGIWIDKGLIDTPDYIGSNYISRLNGKGAILHIDPITEVKGKIVYDSKGRKIGKVSSVNRTKKTNSLSAIIIDRGLIKKPLKLSVSKIKNIGKNIMLKIQVKTLD